ncbi:nitrate- and nitrite sensing domain-containing protein [Pseudonocardia phyllosphaerae]|uniref:nitrate- and nitrite sensing domain-containing protein n=1 Tax=Pseudonocardia phyllosphaerae TaxID=3390502 RepID=UPI00397A697A
MTTVTSADRRSTWSERLDPRNWSLVAKLAVVGLVPTVLALTIGAIRVVDQANVAEDLGRGSGLVKVHDQVTGLTGALQAERNAAGSFVAGNRSGDRAAVEQAQKATDGAVRKTSEVIDAEQQASPELSTARVQAETALGQLPVIRSQVAGGPTAATDVTSRYTSVVQRALALDRALLGRLQTTETAGLTSAVAAGDTAVEALQLERAVVNQSIAGGRLDEAERAQINGAEQSFQAAAGDYQASLSPEQDDRFGDFATGRAASQRNALRDQVLATPPDAPPAVDRNAWNSAVDASVKSVEDSAGQAEQAFVGGRADAAEKAGNQAGLSSVLLMLTLLLTGAIILLLGRQMVRSLRLLRSSALDVAERRLPAAVQGMREGRAPNAVVEPVPLEGRDEIGEVARAFDAVHGQAIRLAADQSALQTNVNSMFVNLSRRSQALVERQLQLIEQLESNEQDPDQLSNLFQLDHLATRMRRNSENLLVLAGTDLAKRNVAPVQVVDVLRAAVSEVEQYQRIVVQTPPEATIAGRAANDLVHLLAELLDNATNFSPPDSQVVMSTTRTADESLLVEISDRGVGMSDGELNDANQRLSGPAEVDVSASRRMGLFVVGRLAARHRVDVRLASAAVGGGSGGLSASVTIPSQLVPSAAGAEQRRDGQAAQVRGGDPVAQQAVTGAGAGAVAAGGAAVAGAAGAASATGARPATESTGRSALPSMVAGSDGPQTPTFETGAAGGRGRNGSTAALPTRRPGSSLRNSGNEAGLNGAAAHDDALNGKGASLNGSAPGGPQAFTTGPSQDGRSAGDVFTPAEEQGPAGPAGPGSDDHSGSGGGVSRGAVAGGAAALGAAGLAGASAFRRPSGPDADEPDTHENGRADSHDDPHEDSYDDATAFDGAEHADAHDVETVEPGTPGTAHVQDSDSSADSAGDDEDPEETRDAVTTVDRAEGDTSAPELDGAEGADESGSRTAHGEDQETDGHGAAAMAATGTAAGAVGVGSAFATGADTGADTDTDSDTHSGTDTGSESADGSEPADDGADSDELRGATGVRTDEDSATESDSAGRADGSPTGTTDADADDAETGTDDADTGPSGQEYAGRARTAPGRELDDTVVMDAATGDGPEQHGARSTDEASGTDDADGTDDGTDRDGHGRTGAAAAGAAGVAGAAALGAAAARKRSTEERPATGREPMGGPAEGHGTTGTRPGPSQRPVMPPARGPARGPGSAPNGAPQQGRPTPQGYPNGAPGRQQPGPRPDGRPEQRPGPQSPGPQTGGSPLPRRQPQRGPAAPVGRGPAGPGGPQGRPGAQQGQGQDELFAPNVPADQQNPGQLRRPGALESVRGQSSGQGGPAAPDATEQTTPIFDDIASAWFRSNRSVPVRWQDGEDPAAGQQAAETEQSGAAPAADFSSPADEAWQQAREVAGNEEESTRPDETTRAGLPKRRPRARLLPGSAAGSTVLSPPPAAEARSAESVRGRLASYQQGVRQGRENAAGRQGARSTTSTTSTDGAPEPSGDRTNQSDPEENQ